MWKPGSKRPGFGSGESNAKSGGAGAQKSRSTKKKAPKPGPKQEPRKQRTGGLKVDEPPMAQDADADDMVDGEPARKRRRKGELSANVRGLKFMKQREEAQAEEAAEAKRQSDIKSTQWVMGATGGGEEAAAEPAGGKLVCERFCSAALQRPRTGRLSFGGFRPALEAAVQGMRSEQERQTHNARALEQEVTDQDMVARFGKYTSVGPNAEGGGGAAAAGGGATAGVRQQGQWGGDGGGGGGTKNRGKKRKK